MSKASTHPPCLLTMMSTCSPRHRVRRDPRRAQPIEEDQETPAQICDTIVDRDLMEFHAAERALGVSSSSAGRATHS